MVSPRLLVDPKWGGCHEAIHLLLRATTCTDPVMKWRKLLHVPEKLRRTRSKARSEIGSVGDQSGVDLAAPRRSESTPDLGTDASTLPTSRPLIPRDKESNGRQPILSRAIHLIGLFSKRRSRFHFRSNSIHSRKRSKQPP